MIMIFKNKVFVGCSYGSVLGMGVRESGGWGNVMKGLKLGSCVIQGKKGGENKGRLS